jgi:hypothetical protein
MTACQQSFSITWPKHVEFYSKNKFEKLVHLVGFIIRIYYDARPSESQKCTHSLTINRELLQDQMYKPANSVSSQNSSRKGIVKVKAKVKLSLSAL